MILEGFEIENWSCIGRVAVRDLPETGLVVLHGPNGTGKSSILEAIRACLMDNKSTSRALGRGQPRNSGDYPRVSVTFRAGGTTWRITKRFGSKESRLERRTSPGAWTLETDDPTEAHTRARALAGGCDSTRGLHQLLWLTQAEFRLPEPKHLDPDVQARLRAVLGVLQTPKDDHFLGRVKEEWSRWFSARNTPGERPKLKKNCPLDRRLAELQQQQQALDEINREYRSFEDLMARSAELEIRADDLSRQSADRQRARDQIRAEFLESRERLRANQVAREQVEAAEAALEEHRRSRRDRIELEGRFLESRNAEEAADREAEEAGARLRNAEARLREARAGLRDATEAGRRLRAQLDRVERARRRIDRSEQVDARRDHLRRAERAAVDLDALKRLALERPAPGASTIRTLEENRAKAARLQAELGAAAIALAMVPDPGAAPPILAIDGGPASEARPPADGPAIARQVRRRAEIRIPGWGRVELARGSDSLSLDQLEHDLIDLDARFAEGVAPYGVPPGDPLALDRLRDLAAEKKAREPGIGRLQEELDRLAPKGLDALREELSRAEKLLESESDDGDAGPGSADGGLPADPAELGRLGATLRAELEANAAEAEAIELRIKGLQAEIDGDPSRSGLRPREAEAKERRATLRATTAALGEQRARLPDPEQLDDAVRRAEARLDEARRAFASSTLSEGEQTIRERLDAAEEALKATEDQRSKTLRQLHEIKGALGQAEGLHQKRSAAEARVEELARLSDRERLESEAYDRLYGLFEECREKQLGVLMGPIHDRVVRWMRLLRVGDYRSIRFNDQFLPDALVAADGALELSLSDESTGTIEQIALMVRLALGSSLSSADEPCVAVLDDPLTHSDVVRLDRMRAVLKDAAAGMPGANPPAGPMQIIVLTCHPEWFAFDGATTIDLSSPDVLARRG